MTVYTVEPATEAGAEYIAANLRKADAAEIWAACRYRPQDGVQKSMLVSRDTMMGTADGVPVCIFGVSRVTFLSASAQPWMLATDELPKHARRFLRMSRNYVAEMRQKYDLMVNYVDARNTEAVKWLGWLGFKLFPPEPYGPDQLPFHRFEMRT